MKHPNTCSKLKRIAAFSAISIGSVALVAATPQLEPKGAVEVAEFIQMDIRHDNTMQGADITVAIDGGIATITGTSRSLAQVERATSRTFASPEVLTVVNMMTISPSDSSEILGNARSLLAKQNLLDAREISVSTEGSRVILDGEVGSMDEAELAREIISETPGVTAVENRLAINFTSIRTGAQIAGQLKYIVHDDPVFTGLELTPSVDDGIVKWSGQVGSRGEFDRLIKKSYVTGVIEVQANNLTVNGDLAMEAITDKNYTSSQCLEALDAALKHDTRIDSGAITTEINDGIIFLKGSVGSMKQSDAVERTARGIPGVLDVSNHLRIENSERIAGRTPGLKSVSVAPVSR